MKKFTLLLIMALSLISCEDNDINEFAMQAKIGNRLYTSTEAQASLAANGTLVIEGSTRLESLTIRINRLKEGEFFIREGANSNWAVFTDMDGKLFDTKPNGSGLVTITEVNLEKKTLSGTFHFNAMRTGIDTVYVSKGVLYNIPYGGGSDNPDGSGSLTAKVDGEPFLPSVVTAGLTGNSIAIFGTAITSTIGITVPKLVEIGEYILPLNGFTAKYQNEAGNQTTTSGRITITEHNIETRSLKGTFSFVTNRSEITEGQFDVIY